MHTQRLILVIVGILLGLFGVFRLLTQISVGDLVMLAVWLVGAVVIHDGVLSPVVAGIGWLIARVVPPRGRRYLQAALVMGALVTVIALPMIYRRNSQPRSKAILEQNFGFNLTLLLAILAVLSLGGYAVHVARDSAGHRDQLEG